VDRFKIIIWPEALAELKQLRAFDRKEVRELIENNLSFQPTVVSRNRKLMDQPEASFDYDPLQWEMIRERRQGEGIPWEEAKRQLDLLDADT
jgi:hypothetical protein